MTPDLAARARATATLGAGAFDDVWRHVRCGRCGAEATLGPENVHQGTIEGLAHLAASVRARGLEPGTTCPGCGGLAGITAVRQHTFSRDAGRDLVVTWSAAHPDEVRLRWWDEAGGEREAEVDPALEASLRRDAALRHVKVSLALGQHGRALEAARPLVEAAPDDPALLPLVADLAGQGPEGRALARAVVDAQGVAAAAALARAALAGERRARLDPDLVAEALDALAPHAHDLEARALGARLLELAGRAEEAQAAWADVAARDPRRADAQAGLARLAADPAASLEHAARAEALDPRDADHPLARARALLRLGRLDEAAAALARGRALEPAHPRVGRLEHELRRRTGREPVEGPRLVVDVLGVSVGGEPTLERGVVPLAGQPEDAVRDVCCALALLQGAALAREPSGAPLRLFQVEGDGVCVTLLPLDDAAAVADFDAEFAALWAEALAEERGATGA